MVLSKKAVQFVSGGIISSYITAHYLEESKHLGVFKQSTKMNVNRTKQRTWTIKICRISWFQIN